MLKIQNWSLGGRQMEAGAGEELVNPESSALHGVVLTRTTLGNSGLRRRRVTLHSVSQLTFYYRNVLAWKQKNELPPTPPLKTPQFHQPQGIRSYPRASGKQLLARLEGSWVPSYILEMAEYLSSVGLSSAFFSQKGPCTPESTD